MKYLEGNSIRKFVRKAIIKKLWELEDKSINTSDLGITLFQYDFMDGGYFLNDFQAVAWQKEYIDDLGEIIEKFKSQFDRETLNKILTDFFHYPDMFVLMTVSEIASYLLAECKTVRENWDNEITLSSKMIKALIRELNGCRYKCGNRKFMLRNIPIRGKELKKCSVN